jgi:hypothetical protein
MKMRFEDCKNWRPEVIGFDTEVVLAIVHQILDKVDADHESELEVIYYDIDDEELKEWNLVGSGAYTWYGFRDLVEEMSIITPRTVKSIKVKTESNSINFYKVSLNPEPRWDIKID